MYLMIECPRADQVTTCTQHNVDIRTFSSVITAMTAMTVMH